MGTVKMPVFFQKKALPIKTGLSLRCMRRSRVWAKHLFFLYNTSRECVKAIEDYFPAISPNLSLCMAWFPQKNQTLKEVERQKLSLIHAFRAKHSRNP